MMLLIHTFVTWLRLGSLALTIAVLTFRLSAFIPSSSYPSPSRVEPVGPGIRPLVGGLVAVIAVTSLMDLFLRVSEMTGRTIPDILAVLPVVVQRTHYGTVWLVRAW